MTSPSSPPPEADLYAGKYRLVREIGRGGMGCVYEAIEAALERTLAVKRLSMGTAGSFEARQRFRREVLAAARLTHPGIAQVLGFGTTDEGEHYIAMELVSGHTLRAEIARTASARDLFALFDQIFAVLAYAHARGVVHLDLKPENILVTRIGAAPVCKLLDFGVARMDAHATPREVVGTPRYMAPEQVRAESAGSTADLYAVGVMLFEALTGIVPIGGSGDDVMERKLSRAAPSLEKTRFGPASPELTHLLDQLLERDAALRIASAADARTALLGCPEAGDAAPHSVRPISVRPSAEPETVRVSRPGMSLARPVPFVGRHRERGLLADALADVASSGAARLVVLEGARGIGKSYLVDWFVRQVREEGGRTVLTATYLDGGGPEGDGLRAAFERYLGASGHGRDAVARAVSRFLGRYGESDPEEEQMLVDALRPRAPSVVDALVDSTRPPRPTHALAVIERAFRRLAHKRPVVVALDDVHLGFGAAFDALAFLLALWRQAPIPILVVATVAAPLEGRAVRHAYSKLLAHEGDQVLRATLGPLADDDIARLVASVVEDGSGAARVASIAARAAGNPLFAVQLGRLARDATVTALAATTLPAGIQQLLEARLETAIAHASSPDTAERVLVTIAFLLPPTPTVLVERALVEDGVAIAAALRALDDLVATRIVREVVRDGVEHVALEHPLLAEALRGRVSQRVARRASAQALALKESYYADREHVVHELAEHARLAGLDDRSTELGLAAARRAYAAGRHGEAQRLLRHLVDLDPARQRSIAPEVALLAAHIADETGDVRFAETALALVRGRDDASEIEASLALARLHTRSGRLDDASNALASAQRSLDAVDRRAMSTPAQAHALGPADRQAPDGVLALRQELLRLEASIARRNGRYADAALLLERAIALDPSAPTTSARLLHDNLAWAHYRAGHSDAALTAARRALEIAPRGLDEAWALRTVAVLGGDRLAAEERRRHLERALDVARASGALRLIASTLTHLGNFDRIAGDFDSAIARYEDVLAIGPDYVDDDDLSESVANLAMLLLDGGRGAEAATTLGRRAPRKSSWESGLALVGAALLAATTDAEAAVADTLAVRAHGQALPACWGVARAAERMLAVLTDLGNVSLAAWAREQAASVWARMGERESSGRTESLRLEESLETTKRETLR